MLNDEMNFKEYIELHRNKIYSTICNYIPIKEPEEHYKMIRDYIDRQGSYRRPGLLMLSGQMFGASIDKLILPAAAMQLSEDWILIHDDVEDHSELRRGKPAIQKIYGDELAINAGDGGHIAMWKIIKDSADLLGKKRGALMFDKFYNMLERTVEGQFLDTNFIYNTRSIRNASEDLYYKIIQSKTCYYTVYGPMQLGAIAAGSRKGYLNILEKIGTNAGIAFQIVDDILDMTADEKVFGKQRYGDIYEGKVTIIALNAFAKADNAEKEKLDSIYAKPRKEKTKEDIAYVVDLVNKYGCIDYAKDIARSYGEKARDAVEKYKNRLPTNEYTDIMLSAMEEMYMRSK